MADYVFLTAYTCVRANTGLKNPSIRAKFDELSPVGSNPNMKRVLDNIMGPLQATVDALQPTMI